MIRVTQFEIQIQFQFEVTKPVHAFLNRHNVVRNTSG